MLNAAITSITRLVIATLMLGVIAILLVGVVLRYVVGELALIFDWPSIDYFWVEEVGGLVMCWLTMLGAAVGVRERSHFKLMVLESRLNDGGQRLHRIGVNLVIAVFGVVLCHQSARLSVLNRPFGSPSVGISLFWFYFSGAVGGAVITALAILNLFSRTPAHQRAGAHGA